MTHLPLNRASGVAQPARLSPPPPCSTPRQQPAAALHSVRAPNRRRARSRSMRTSAGPAARTATARAARRLAVLLIVLTVLLTGIAGCSARPSPGLAGAGHDRPTASPALSASPRSAPLATLNGPRHLRLTLTSALRDTGGFITVRGTLANTAATTTIVSAHLSGNEPDIAKHGPSLGGATLVDFAGGKRYYVLRDTEGRPLTTTGLSVLKAREIIPVYMQFPAPPAHTRQVTFQLPQFDTASIAISG